MPRELTGFLALGGIIFLALIVESSTPVKIAYGENCNLTISRDPYFIFGGLLIGILSIGFPQIKPVTQHATPITLWRRFFAALADLHISIFLALTVVSLGLYAALFLNAGSWNWADYSGTEADAGLLSIGGALVGFLILYAYFWLPPKIGRATIGQYIMGFQIISDSETPIYVLRPILGYFAIGSFVIWAWFDSKGATEGRYWWDRATGTRPVKVSG